MRRQAIQLATQAIHLPWQAIQVVMAAIHVPPQAIHRVRHAVHPPPEAIHWPGQTGCLPFNLPKKEPKDSGKTKMGKAHSNSKVE